MILHRDLLEQAEFLAKREPKKPRQASLRRAVSAAYYAIFHMLTNDGVVKLIPNAPSPLRPKARRAFGHGEMKSACEQFAKWSGGGPLNDLIDPPLEPQIRGVASAFVDLQQARHAADYDLTETFDRVRVLRMIDLAKVAAADRRKVRNKPNANVFLASLLLSGRWNK